MDSFVVDTSALLAILNAEPEAEALMLALDQCAKPLVSAATLYEAHCVARRSDIERGNERLDQLVALVDFTIRPFDAEQLHAAKAAYLRYGRGTGHRAKLNMGDCYAYALALTRSLPLLFKGGDFIHTDVEPALKRG